MIEKNTLPEIIFGTDGIRGRVNGNYINAITITRIAMAIGHYFKKCSQYKDKVIKVIIAKDTRLSGYILESALTSGFASLGIDVTLVGPMPTPSVPMLIHSLRADFGIMITASHNPHHDNGIKVFDYNGVKINNEQQRQIEQILNGITNDRNCMKEVDDSIIGMDDNIIGVDDSMMDANNHMDKEHNYTKEKHHDIAKKHSK